LPEQGGLDWDCLPLRASFSADGRYLVFEGRVPLVAGERARCYPFNRAGECPDIYLLDRSTGRISRQSVSNSGAEANGWSRDAVLSADGRFIVFSSTASNLVRGDTNRAQSCADDLANPINCSDIFVREWRAGITSRASVG
jgi:Tol biopolymer transport system component